MTFKRKIGGLSLAACLAGSLAGGGEAEVRLPPPPEPFRGTIGKTYKDSNPDFPQPIQAPADAPNVLLILIDDMGFGASSTFGGVIPTPNLDRLAERGLRYNTFHTTALSSPTRAALLTGRNHHQSGNATITEGSTGFPGYNSLWEQDIVAIPEVLRGNGYGTAAFGKWHNTSDWESSPAGPFDRWPTGKGFETFYGFIGGETSQYYPQLYRNTTPIEPPKTPEQGYILTPDLADQAINWLHVQTSVAPDKPWFMYFAPGALHAPHQAPKQYIDRFKGKFDLGWDAFRKEVFARQKKMGIIPPDAKLTVRPKEMPAWDSLSPDEKRVYARQMEVYAAMLSQLDENIGRLLDAVDKSPHADDTLVIAILGDNGCSPEGGLTGTMNDMGSMNGLPDDMQNMLAHLDDLGGPDADNNFSAIWAWAVDTPFQWTKEVASHFGGTRNPMIVAWPERIKPDGKMRSQFHHVIDVAPTIYESAGIVFPEYFNGLKQVPLAGISFAYTFSDAQAKGRRTEQYFEMYGNRAMYRDGWIAAARHGLPWILLGRKGDFENDMWELYNLEKDFSEADDVAAQYPDKLKELQDLFDRAAGKYNVYPLDDRFAERAVVPDRPSVTRGRDSFVYPGPVTRIPEGSAPNVKAKSHRITAKVAIPAGGAQGVVVAAGGIGGYSFFIKDGYLMYENSFFGRERDLIKSNIKVPTGKKVTLKFEYRHTAKEFGGGGTGRIFIDGKQVGQMDFAHVPPVRYSATETFDIGNDLGQAVSTQYKNGFPFTGTIEEVRIDLLDTPLPTAEVVAKTQACAAQAAYATH